MVEEVKNARAINGAISDANSAKVALPKILPSKPPSPLDMLNIVIRGVETINVGILFADKVLKLGDAVLQGGLKDTDLGKLIQNSKMYESIEDLRKLLEGKII